MTLESDGRGVWVSPRRVWVPAGAPVSACAAGRGCLPVTEPTSCAPPECPGSGTVFTVGSDAAAVSDFPTDHDGYQREIELLRADPSLGPIAGYLVDHPDHARREEERRRNEENDREEHARHEEDVRWVSRHRHGDRFEIGLSGTLATLAEQGGSYAGATASFGLYFQLEANESDESREDPTVMNIFFGDTFGADLRVHFLHRLDDSQAAQWITAIGVAPVLFNRFERSVVRLPTYWGTVFPEFGVILRADRDPTWYVSWEVPFSFLVHHDLAIDVAARVFIVDDWESLPPDAPDDADDPVETILMLSAGFRLP